MSNKKRIAVYGSFFVIGLIAVALSAFGRLDDIVGASGLTLAAISVLQLFKAARYAKDPAFAKRIDVSNTDERLAYLANKSAQSSFQVSVLALCALSLVLRPFGYGEIANVLGFVACGQLTVYWVTYLIASRKY